MPKFGYVITVYLMCGLFVAGDFSVRAMRYESATAEEVLAIAPFVVLFWPFAAGGLMVGKSTCEPLTEGKE